MIVRTALLLAMTVLFQMLRPLFLFNPVLAQIVVGSLVNVALFVSAATLGWRGSVIVACVSPFTAWILGQASSQFGQVPHPLLIPFIAIGNLALVLLFELIEMHCNQNVRIWIGMVISAAAKAGVLFLSIVEVFVPLILPGLQLNGKIAGALTVSFGWLQLVTAVIGGIVAMPVLKGLRAALSKDRRGSAIS